eukprot:TRINITY_DN5800_c0_g1_i4.p1 TRINITY_DN5800_c0_g1~~TRINITY_DN5800_c0_g1_i4.p1  ORF type:complete len:355 (-),score=108.27 TRINITY_DN5800_c0_g1_i4:60-1124(-)
MTFLFKVIVTELKKAGAAKKTKKKVTTSSNQVALPSVASDPDMTQQQPPLPVLPQAQEVKSPRKHTEPSVVEQTPPVPTSATKQAEAPKETEPTLAKEIDNVEVLVGQLHKAYKTQFAQSFKKIMTQLYSNIQGGLEDKTYTSDEVLELCRQQLKSITVEVVNQAMTEPSEHKPTDIQRMIEQSFGKIKASEESILAKHQATLTKEAEIATTTNLIAEKENKLRTLKTQLHNQEEQLKAKTRQLEADEAKLQKQKQEFIERKREKELDISASPLTMSSDSNGSKEDLPSLNEQPQSIRWVPDNEVNNCLNCNAPFSLFSRKHHCRKCGQIFCGACSSRRTRTNERVCDACFKNS